MKNHSRDGILVWALIALVVIGTLFRFLYGIIDNPLDHLFSDPRRHWENALRFFSPSLMNGCDPILYQGYLFVVQHLTGCGRLAIGIATGLLSAVMPWTFYRAARELGLARTPSMVFWMLMIWMPSFLVIYRYFMIETLLLPLIGIGLWMTGRAMRRKDLLSFLIMIGCWTLACLTKPAAIPMALIGWIYVLVAMKKRLLPAFSSAVLVAAFMLPNAIRSYAILGYYAPLGSGYIAQIMHEGGTKHTRFHWKSGTWIYSSPSCYIEPLYPLDHWMIERGYGDEIQDIFIRKNSGRQDWKDALKAKSPAFSVWMHHWGENIVLFLFAPSWPDSGGDTWLGEVNYWLRWIWAPIFFLVLVENIDLFRQRRFPLIPVLTTVTVLILLFQNSVAMEGRYRKPVEPLLLLNLVLVAATLFGNRKPEYATT